MIIEKGKVEHSMKTQNPFVATMYHMDLFPAGNGKLGPSIAKKAKKGGDYDLADDWRMYYGKELPGFPAHPHRGFETVTVVLQGTVDHTDGLGSRGRYEADGRFRLQKYITVQTKCVLHNMPTVRLKIHVDN